MNKSFNKLFITAISIIFIASCGGGGGGGGTTAPPTSPSVPTVNLSANPTSVELDNSSTLSWSSTNATTCSAAWTTSNETSGSEDVTISTAGNNTFSITCTGAGGSNSASVEVEGYRSVDGISVDGYISGAEICIDENENWLCDSGENSTTSDNEGEFNIKYANGNLLSIGGTDLDTQVLLDNLLINHQLTGHSEFKVISPITSVASFLSDSSIINPALGIDNSIDVYTFDPVSNKSQSVINDYVYEKGNQLTVLAFTLQNLTNSINTSAETTQDFFKSISEELEQEHSQTNELVDIESSVFIQKVLENVISEKSLSVGDSSKANTVSAISNVLPILKVYSDNQITKAVFNFSISTLQDEIPSITNGTADETLINSYTSDIYNYIADDQNIDVTAIRPNTSPRITSNITDLKIDENEFNVATISAVDDDGDQIYFSLSGTDSALLDISSTGEISFRASPDFEVPSDSDGDNNYEFKVSVTDDASASNSGYDISRSSDDNANVAVQNIDEDLIFFNLTAINGTQTSNPVLNVALQIDSLTGASEAQLLVEYPILSDPDSTELGDGKQEWMSSGIGSNNGINWTISKELPSYVLSGNYKVRKLRILRSALDDLEISDSTISTKGFKSYVNLQNPKQDITLPVLQSISDFTITGNDGNSSTDINVTFDAAVVEDNLSEVRVFILYPGGATKDFLGTISANGSISFDISLNSQAASGTYKIDRFIITDLAGNRITYSNSDLISLNLNNSWELSNSISDDSAPEISSLRLAALYDNNDFSRKNIQVKVVADAQESPLERIYIRLTNEDGVTQIDEEFPSQQFVLTSAEYTHTFALPFEYPGGTYTVDYIFIKDKAENKTNYTTSDIKNNSWDHEVKFEGKNQFIGKVIDGYISGAEVFIDQNFNFNRDLGELYTISQENGSFFIGTDDDSLYTCLKNRPIVASVPVGANDATLGNVENAFRMVLPSINDAGTDAIVITPFTDLLSQAIINAKSSSSITEDLTVLQGCENSGDSIATSVTNEINQIMQTIESSFGVSLNDLVTDYIQGSSNSIINETKAQRIGSFLPYFKLIQDEIDADLSGKYNKTINTNLTLRDSSINTILSDNTFTLLPIDFYTVYKTEPNASGWYTEESVRAKGAKLSNNGEIHHFKCITEEENCITSDYSTSNIGDASEDYNNMTYFVNPNYSTSENVAFFIQDNRRWGEQTRDGQVVLEKDCVFTEQLDFAPNERGDSWLNTRMNSSVLNYDIQVDSCAGLSSGDKNLFTAKTFTYETSSAYETSEMQYINSSFAKAKYLKNKVEDPYTNRETIDLNAVITELKGLPYRYKDLNKARAYADDIAGDRVSMNFTMRDQNGTGLETHSITVRDNPEDDEYSKLERNSEGAYIETVKSVGQQARDDMFAALQASSGLNDEEFIGTESVKDNRVLISGKTIDGYISGATVFVDVNFNQRLDAGEYSASTNTNGIFELAIDQNDLSCINARPLVANVPVGAIDSTLGTVTKSYQMLLPSINDAGSNQIVVSPFTSLLAEAILKGKAESEIVEDLTVTEGCQQAGDDVASRISSEVSAMKTLIENTYDISWADLVSDFIETGGTSKISESLATKVASFFPYYKDVKDEIAVELSQKFEKDVTPNVSLSENSLSSILSSNDFTELPLEFFSVYKTKKNSSGWYQVEELSASNSFILSNGKLSREHCSQTDTIGCELDEITLENVANASTNFSSQSNFFNDDITIAGLKSGSLAVYAFDMRDWRDGSVNWQERNNRARECRSSDDIQFQVVDENNMLKNFHYSSYSQGYGVFDCGNYREYYYPKLNIATIFNNNQADNSIQMNYYITDVTRSGIINNPPYDFVQNRLTINPSDVIEEMAALPAYYADINSIRRKLVGDEYVLVEYHADPNISYFEMGSFPRNDNYRANINSEDIRGQAARDAFFEKLKTEPTFDEAVYGTSAPINNTVLGRVAKSVVEIMDYKGSTQVALPIYPTYDASTKTLNMSLINSELNVDNIKDFLEKGINENPLDAKLYYHPDDSISGTIPIKLYLYKGDDDIADSGEGYFLIEFSIDVTSQLNADYSAKQTFVIDENAIIKAKYIEDDVTISKNIINGSADTIIVEDDADINNTQPISQPANLQLKILNIISTISDDISGVQGFFQNGESYTFKIDFGGFSLIDYERNTVDVIKGTFKVSSSPTYAINVDNVEVREDETANICFYRPSVGDLSATSMNLSFTQRERPGRGAFADDFSLSSNTVTFDEGDTQACIQVTGSVDNHFDWFHDAYINISQPTNGQKLSRDVFKIRIRDAFGAQNRIGWYER